MLTGLGSPKNSKSKFLLYNSYTGSRMSDFSISFKYKKPLITKFKDIFSKTQNNTFDVIGKLKWEKEPRKVLCGTPNKRTLA